MQNKYLEKLAEESYDTSYPSTPTVKGLRALGSGVTFGALGAAAGAVGAPLLLGKKLAGKAIAQKAATGIGAKALGGLGAVYGVGRSVRNQIKNDQQRIYKEASDNQYLTKIAEQLDQ